MQAIEVKRNVVVPSLADYGNAYPRVPCNTEGKAEIFKIITEAANVNAAITVVEETGNSPVSVYESRLAIAVKEGKIKPLTWHEKQFVGACAAVVMECNGWKKTGKKQRFSRGIFKSAELYSNSNSSHEVRKRAYL